ncbi:polyphosphate kinase 1 [Flavobacterium salilacus subsp. salilacus]|uniref:polyphosphate kinase 1 n=1 Tax=Flavobacterium TaxID=237 RepID=UPI001074DFF0|nr:MULTISPECIES: polyphosphate kinase 1 [Flavobacterium]KAF2519319.1 polyphosphate kinase 1 [Flavobacterium salilacus subsp. salilacus]MBE1613510.1 polyphosphate kinase 1 [Flavobacterium sp. SaA2.13]
MEEKTLKQEVDTNYIDRDLSWLIFNERVLLEATNENVPIFERLKFISIYSSNLDEFYRVRIPALTVLKKIAKKEEKNQKKYKDILSKINKLVHIQQQMFGKILREKILPGLKEQNIHLLYDVALPQEVLKEAENYFFTHVLAFLKPVLLNGDTDYFTENHKLFFLVPVTDKHGGAKQYMLNIPSEELSRFYTVTVNNKQYILFLDDIIKYHLQYIFADCNVEGTYSFKITRDAALEFDDEYSEDLAERMEKKIANRDFGLATRFLYDAKMPEVYLHILIDALKLKSANLVAGSCYHNLKDFASLPINKPSLEYAKWIPVNQEFSSKLLLDHITMNDMIIHTPYHSYDTILRFFNEAAIHKDVEEIYVTVYRVANDSRIANALISAARNGKKVTVVVELKARFDESNNIKWAKKLSDAGVKIVYSVPSLKIHAKTALIKFNTAYKLDYLGLLATGNLNESTARFYTDHILLTSHQEMLKELENTFHFLCKAQKPAPDDNQDYNHLLVAQFNLLDTFVTLINNEIVNSNSGLPAAITIKLNNLEERLLINKLYEASCAGVKIKLIVRGICCLVPGIEGLSENITVKRIVDRYLEHGRVFIFHNNGDEKIYMGSSDWMNRNIYRRIEVCFPIYDEVIKQQIKDIITLQLQDNGTAIRSQENIYRFLSGKL